MRTDSYRVSPRVVTMCSRSGQETSMVVSRARPGCARSRVTVRQLWAAFLASKAFCSSPCPLEKRLRKELYARPRAPGSEPVEQASVRERAASRTASSRRKIQRCMSSPREIRGELLDPRRSARGLQLPYCFRGYDRIITSALLSSKHCGGAHAG